MKRIDFKNLRNFTLQEIRQHYYSKGFKWANPEIHKIKKQLFIKLQKVRTQIGRPIKINRITEGKSKYPTHENGLGIDWRVGGKGRVNYNKVLQACIDAGFKGIGFYPYWAPSQGFHTDIIPGGVRVWLRDAAGVYRGLI